jgi:hypothetical protein
MDNVNSGASVKGGTDTRFTTIVGEIDREYIDVVRSK